MASPLRPRWCMTLLFLLAISLVSEFPRPCAAQSKMVFAHYMLYSFLYSDDVAGFTKEIELAKSHGIDGFALNTGVWNDIYQTRADYFYQAAVNSGGFMLFFSADMSGSLTLANIQTMLTRYAGYSSQLTINGQQFVSTFAGRTVSISPPYTDPLSAWRDGVFTPAGGSYYFVPFFETNGQQSDITAVINEFDSILSGLLAWDTSAWPYVNGAVSDAADQAYIAACGAAGKVYMASVSPWFYNGTAIKGNYGGDTLWRTHWQQLVSLQPNFIEILTWNDWAERHYVVSVPSDNTPYGVNTTTNNDAAYPHLAYLDLAGRYFIPWYKTGQQPAIDSASEEALYIFYYTQSKSGSSVTNSGDLDDKVYATALLYQPADIVLTSGTQSMTFSVAAGLQSVSMAFNPGQQSVSVARNGAQILSVTGALSIASEVSQYDFNVYSNFQTAS